MKYILSKYILCKLQCMMLMQIELHIFTEVISMKSVYNLYHRIPYTRTYSRTYAKSTSLKE